MDRATSKNQITSLMRDAKKAFDKNNKGLSQIILKKILHINTGNVYLFKFATFAATQKNYRFAKFIYNC
jgi:hypothetical protein